MQNYIKSFLPTETLVDIYAFFTRPELGQSGIPLVSRRFYQIVHKRVHEQNEHFVHQIAIYNVRPHRLISGKGNKFCRINKGFVLNIISYFQKN